MMGMITIANANALYIPLPDQSVQCVVTSPPYWGLRDYGISDQIGLESTPAAYVAHIVAVMRECWRVLKDDGVLWLNLGDSYFGGGQRNQGNLDCQPKWSQKANRETVKRGDPDPVHGLKFKDLVGIPWMVARALQQPYYTCESCGVESHSMLWQSVPPQFVNFEDGLFVCPNCNHVGEPKQITGGWYLRSDVIEKVELYCPCGCGYVLEEKIWRYSQDREIIWHKPNPMPESVTDRPTKAHEYVFLLTKRERYYYDAEAIKEPNSETSGKWGNDTGSKTADAQGNGKHGASSMWRGMSNQEIVDKYYTNGRNRRSVWTVATSPYSGAHFATFPPALIEPMILAGTSARGECPYCGKAWVRVVEHETGDTEANQRHKRTGGMHSETSTLSLSGNGSKEWAKRGSKSNTIGWRPQCDCRDLAVCTGDHSHDCLLCNNTGFVPMIPEPIPQTVLDPFAGSGTTGAVAVKHGRRAVLLDLNTKYINLQFERTSNIQINMQM